MATFNDTQHQRTDLLVWRDALGRMIVWTENAHEVLSDATLTIMMMDVQPREDMEVKEL